MGTGAVAAARRAGGGARDLATAPCYCCRRHRLEGVFAFAAAGGLPCCVVLLRAGMLLDGPDAKLFKQDLAPAVPVTQFPASKSNHKSRPGPMQRGRCSARDRRHTHVSISRKEASASVIRMPHSACDAVACSQSWTSQKLGCRAFVHRSVPAYEHLDFCVKKTPSPII